MINKEKLRSLKEMKKSMAKILAPAYEDALNYAVQVLDNADIIEQASAEAGK